MSAAEGSLPAGMRPGRGGTRRARGAERLGAHRHRRVIRLIVDRSEMGQGGSTALPMLLAEELEVPLEGVQFEFAPSDEAYFN